MARSEDLLVLADRSPIALAGLVVARQRPATAKGVVFMLLEDEAGVANVIVPPPVYERCRLAVRTASFALVRGRLERREGVINVVAEFIEALAAPDRAATVRQIEPERDARPERDAELGRRSSPPSRLGPTASAGVAEALLQLLAERARPSDRT